MLCVLGRYVDFCVRWLKAALGLGARAVADPISAVVQDSLAHKLSAAMHTTR